MHNSASKLAAENGSGYVASATRKSTRWRQLARAAEPFAVVTPLEFASMPVTWQRALRAT